jgi:hypothetical protein
VYGDIGPGEKVAGSTHYLLLFSETCEDSIWISFKADIYSDNYLFWSDTFSVFVTRDPTGVLKNDKYIPREFALKQNYPNPFNPVTMINYQLSMTNEVDLSVYNLLGQKVASLVNEKQNPGYHQVEWDASGFASGVYYYRLQAGEFQDMKKMILLK